MQRTLTDLVMFNVWLPVGVDLRGIHFNLIAAGDLFIWGVSHFFLSFRSDAIVTLLPKAAPKRR